MRIQPLGLVAFGQSGPELLILVCARDAVVSDGCRGIDTEGIAKAEAGLQAAGVTITTLEAYVKSDPVASTPEGTAEVTVQDTK